MARPGREPKIAVFIDWQNMLNGREIPKQQVDLNRIMGYIYSLGKPIRAFVYLPDFQHDIPAAHRKENWMVCALEHRLFTVRQKTAARQWDAHYKKFRLKANMDVEMASDVIESLYQVGQDLDRAVLFSGDGDFAWSLQKIRRFRTLNPIETLVIGRPGHISPQLALHADRCLTLKDVGLSFLCA